MTLGLVTTDHHAIYLAIEYRGLPCGSLNSKILTVQTSPKVVILLAGGLTHWDDVKKQYVNKPTVEDAAVEVVKLLKSLKLKKRGKGDTGNQAYGRLCGYCGQKPTCYKIDKPLDADPNDVTMIPCDILNEVQEIGEPCYATHAKAKAKHLISLGVVHQCALEISIAEQIAISSQVHDGKLVLPIHHDTIAAPTTSSP
jgi:hypothetical protein